jgi:hypothetical protein
VILDSAVWELENEADQKMENKWIEDGREENENG